jgi:hypothetical protein
MFRALASLSVLGSPRHGPATVVDLRERSRRERGKAVSE